MVIGVRGKLKQWRVILGEMWSFRWGAEEGIFVWKPGDGEGDVRGRTSQAEQTGSSKAPQQCWVRCVSSTVRRPLWGESRVAKRVPMEEMRTEREWEVSEQSDILWPEFWPDFSVHRVELADQTGIAVLLRRDDNGCGERGSRFGWALGFSDEWDLRWQRKDDCFQVLLVVMGKLERGEVGGQEGKDQGSLRGVSALRSKPNILVPMGGCSWA